MSKIETGLTVGNRWEMFVSGWKEKWSAALDVFLVHWVSWLSYINLVKTIYESQIIVVHPISCLNFFFSFCFSLNQHHRICFMWSFFMIANYALKPPEKKVVLRWILRTDSNFHRNINKEWLKNVKKLFSFMLGSCCRGTKGTNH